MSISFKYLTIFSKISCNLVILLFDRNSLILVSLLQITFAVNIFVIILLEGFVMKKKIVLILIGCMLVTGFGWAGGAQEDSKTVSIATAGTAGALYPMGVALAEVLNNNIDDMTASAESSGASLENMRNLMQGNVEWGISQNEVAFQAYDGLGPYEGKEFNELRSLFGTLISWIQVFVPADSDIDEISDMEGKRIGVGQAGSGG